jgi:hypothetical protein
MRNEEAARRRRLLPRQRLDYEHLPSGSRAGGLFIRKRRNYHREEDSRLQRDTHRHRLEKVGLDKVSDDYLTKALYIAGIIATSIVNEQMRKMTDKYRERLKQQQQRTEAIKSREEITTTTSTS